MDNFSDSPEFPPEDPDAFNGSEYSGDENDVYKSSDIVPEPDLGSSPEHRELSSPGFNENVDVGETDGLVANPWRLKHIHYIGNVAVDGDDADPAVHETVRQLRESMADDSWRIAQELLTTPSLNQEYAEDIADVRDALTRDFGEDTGQIPMHIVGSSDAKKIMGTGIGGAVMHGFMVVGSFSDDNKQIFGKRPTITTMLEMGAKARTGDESIVSAAYNIGAGWRKTTKYDVELVSVDSFQEVRADPKRGVIIEGNFIEDGFAASYAIRALNDPDNYYFEVNGYSVDGNLEITLNTRTKRQIVFTDGTEQLPHYDAKSDRLYLPWRYAHAVAPGENGQGVQALPQPSHVNAYGIDLLDTHLPGLYGQMMQAHNTPGLKEHIKERVNTIEPDLYKRLAALPRTFLGTLEGVKITVESLGLTNRPVPPEYES